MLALIAADRFGRFQRVQLVESKAPQDAADGGRRDAKFGSDLLARVALAAQLLHLLDNRLSGGSIQPVRPGRTIL